MKKILVVFALFAALIFVASCGGGSKSVNQNDESDTGETVTDGDTADSESSDTEPGGTDTELLDDSDSDDPDTAQDNPDSDNPDSAPDNGDSQPDDGDTELSDDADSDDPDTAQDNPDSDNPDSAPDNGDSQPDDGDTELSDDADSDDPDTAQDNPDSDNPDSAPDNGDSQPDNDSNDTEPDNDYPQTPCDPNPCLSDANSTGVCTVNNTSYVCGCKSGYIFDGTLCIKSLPECSSTSNTPCLDSATGLIWSAKSENKMPWNDAVNYCQDLTEGDFNDWRLPSIAVLKTLVQNCSSEKCSDDYTGKYSKFGDTVYLWSSSEGEDSTAKSIYFSDAGTYLVSTDTNVNVRCVRREAESRESNCTGLIENSVWNTATQITQTWDWETAAWTPSSESSYNTNPSTNACRFKCDSNYFLNGSSHCLNPCDPNPCTGIGETGTCIGKSANKYICECEENYFWNGSSHCLNPCDPNPCTGIGETGTCIGKSANKYICECEENYFWNGSSHCLNPCEPNPCTGIGETGICLGENANKYSCECENNYVWNPYSNECMKNPCNIPNSTGTYNPVNETQYTCECEEKYFFDSDSGKCLNPCESNPCNAVAHSTHECTASAWHQYSCECENNYYWWGLEKGCQDTRPTLGNICTGQDKCYNNTEEITCPSSSSKNFFGQDAQYTSKCTAQSFSSSTNVVVDNNTGLTWEKSPSSSTYTWANRATHCNELNSSNYGGKSNWRVPNPLELLTIVDNSTYNPATNSNFTNMPSSVWFWTSAEYKGNTSYAYAFMPYYGNYYGYPSDSYLKTNTYKVLCVSGDEMQPATSADFTAQTISGKVVVTDSKTGLMWQIGYAVSTTLQQALKHCESLVYAGYDDWRLPNKNELASLLDPGKSEAPYSNFPGMPSDWFWSSSTYVSNTAGAWSVSFRHGLVSYYGKTSGLGVRCVR